ncbi:tripartite tricarboxylate transporter TctB family protein [Oceanibacterium hippocampi]|uniref:Tripartite tricarboxylate transporter TctB family protein n=1 Tax=Oceanibacterium hippocampi TaxID=745714 RepID=A0A1Y5RXZ0_9PROT|nr:tripartite tricarboxylate transporter TctB family protein [Oceanibacterium hippocampi]SLN27808.1 Tripartite tricarboxylate transporter TctB family protein [Oceanibacterium hippocampi]
MTDSRMVRADFVSAIVFVALGVATLVESWRMPRLEEMNINPWSAPGIVPGVLGAIIAVLGALMLVRSCRQGGWRLAPGEALRGLGSAGSRRAALTLFLTIGYAGGLIGRMPFWLATFLFIFVFIQIFEWTDPALASRRLWRVTSAALVAAIAAFAIAYVFENVFLVNIP